MKRIFLILAAHLIMAGVLEAQTVSIFAGAGTAGFGGDGGPALKASFNGPGGLAFDSKGNIYVADADNYRVRRIDAQGIITTFAGNTIIANGPGPTSGNGGPATQAEIGSPVAVAVDDTGNVYIKDSWNNVIRRVNPSGIISTFRGDWPNPMDLKGSIYIADTANNLIKRKDKNGTVVTFAGNGKSSIEIGNYIKGEGGLATAAYLNHPSDVAVDTGGNVYFTDESLGGLVVMVNRRGIIHVIAERWSLDKEADTQGYPFVPMPAKFSPSGLAVSADGFIYISCFQTNRIYKLKSFPDSIASVQRTFTVKPWQGDTPGSIVFLTVGPTQPPPTGTQPPPTGTQPPPTGTQPPPTGTQPPPTGTQPPPAPIIWISVNNGLDFKSVETDGGASTWGIVILNQGTAPLEVKAVVSGLDSSDFSVDAAVFSVQPGESQRLKITFSPRTGGEKKAVLVFQSNSKENPFATVDLKGVGLAPLSPDFNGDGWVDFSDLWPFVDAFGFKVKDKPSTAKFDLDGDGEVGFGDFFIFANAFGKKAP